MQELLVLLVPGPLALLVPGPLALSQVRYIPQHSAHGIVLPRLRHDDGVGRSSLHLPSVPPTVSLSSSSITSFRALTCPEAVSAAGRTDSSNTVRDAATLNSCTHLSRCCLSAVTNAPNPASLRGRVSIRSASRLPGLIICCSSASQSHGCVHGHCCWRNQNEQAGTG